MGMPDCADCQGNGKGWQVKMIRSGRRFVGACGLSAAKERSYCIMGCQGGEDVPIQVMILRAKESYAQYYMAQFANGDVFCFYGNLEVIRLK